MNREKAKEFIKDRSAEPLTFNIYWTDAIKVVDNICDKHDEEIKQLEGALIKVKKEKLKYLKALKEVDADLELREKLIKKLTERCLKVEDTVKRMNDFLKGAK